jgi:hypothetical protein
VAPIIDGYYSVTLPNADSYKVAITWKFLKLFKGETADAGTLNLDTYESQIARNWAG